MLEQPYEAEYPEPWDLWALAEDDWAVEDGWAVEDDWDGEEV